jgi:hypothetical protein
MNAYAVAITLNSEPLFNSVNVMQMRPISIVTSIVLSIGIFSANAETLTLSAVFPGTAGGNVSTNYDVPTNVVAQVVFAHCPANSGYASSIQVTINGKTANFSGSSGGTVANLPTVVGPATITLGAGNSSSGFNGLAFCTIQTTSSFSFTASTGVVIPNDAGGPVTVILESSTDLITWTAANPGTYGTTSTNRFFRVRAQR